MHNYTKRERLQEKQEGEGSIEGKWHVCVYIYVCVCVCVCVCVGVEELNSLQLFCPGASGLTTQHVLLAKLINTIK